MKRIFLLTSSILFGIFALTAGGSQESATAGPEAPPSPGDVKDARGRTITLHGAPGRIVSLGPNITEIIYALNRGDSLVGRTDWCDYPHEASTIPSVGGPKDPSLETILSLRPDLVIASTHAPLESLGIMEEAGLLTLVLYGPETYDGAYQVIETVGRILGADAAAAELLEEMRRRTAAVLTRAAALTDKPRVYYAVGFGEGGDWTATGDTFIHQMLTMAGGRNVAAGAAGWSFSLERLVLEDPDMIILNRGLANSFKRTPIYKELKAVKDGQIFEVDENTIVRQGPRLIDGLETLNALFGP